MSATKFVTSDKCRLSYVNLFQATQVNGKGDATFRVAVLIPKDDTETLNRVKKALDAAKEEGKASKWKGVIPKGFWNPVQDGDLKADESPEYAGHWYINAKNTKRPGVVDENLNKIIDPDDVYSGCYGRVSITFFPFNTNNNGVGASLNNVMKCADGERLGSGIAAPEDDFAEFANKTDDDIFG